MVPFPFLFTFCQNKALAQMDMGLASMHKGQNISSRVYLTPDVIWAPMLVTLLRTPTDPKDILTSAKDFFYPARFSFPESRRTLFLLLTTAWWPLPGNSVACDTGETVPALTWVCVFMVLLLHCAPNSTSHRVGWLCLHSLCSQSRGRDVSPFIPNYAEICLEALQIMETIQLYPK